MSCARFVLAATSGGTRPGAGSFVGDTIPERARPSRTDPTPGRTGSRSRVAAPVSGPLGGRARTARAVAFIRRRTEGGSGGAAFRGNASGLGNHRAREGAVVGGTDGRVADQPVVAEAVDHPAVHRRHAEDVAGDVRVGDPD